MPSKEKEVYAAIYQIRTLFNTMARYADRLHEKTGISASERAIMETLDDEARTVPDVARGRNVTRQHVQSIVNQLQEKGLVDLRPNPAHKRSALVALTEQGRSLFDTIRQTEQAELGRISKAIKREDIQTTREVLSNLQSTFQNLLDVQEENR